MKNIFTLIFISFFCCACAPLTPQERQAENEVKLKQKQDEYNTRVEKEKREEALEKSKKDTEAKQKQDEAQAKKEEEGIIKAPVDGLDSTDDSTSDLGKARDPNKKYGGSDSRVIFINGSEN